VIDCAKQPVDLGLPNLVSFVNSLDPLPPTRVLVFRPFKHDSISVMAAFQLNSLGVSVAYDSASTSYALSRYK
jgi:hypothetical protein